MLIVILVEGGKPVITEVVSANGTNQRLLIYHSLPVVSCRCTPTLFVNIRGAVMMMATPRTRLLNSKYYTMTDGTIELRLTYVACNRREGRVVSSRAFQPASC